MKIYPTCKTMCATCPYRDDSPYKHFRQDLTDSALSEGSRVCHSTGSNNLINRRTGKKPRYCRGARDVQIRFFHAIGFLEEPTDAAWAKKLKEMGMLK